MSSPARATGIPESLARALQKALEGTSPEERLAVCLYYQRDLPIELQTLDRIEHDLREIFPRNGKGRIKRPEDYTDFQASAIRFVFNNETRTGRIPRLFDNPKRGRWRNTAAGNELAEAILQRAGIFAEGHPVKGPPADVESPRQAPSADEPPYLLLRVALEDFLARPRELIDQIREGDGSVLLTVDDKAIAEVVPVYREPPPELAGSLLWQAEDAFDPMPELWEAAR